MTMPPKPPSPMTPGDDPALRVERGGVGGRSPPLDAHLGEALQAPSPSECPTCHRPFPEAGGLPQDNEFLRAMPPEAAALIRTLFAMLQRTASPPSR